MKATDLRKENNEQLEERLKETREILFKLRFQSETERLEAPSEMIKNKRDIARILTILNERERNSAKAASS